VFVDSAELHNAEVQSLCLSVWLIPFLGQILEGFHYMSRRDHLIDLCQKENDLLNKMLFDLIMFQNFSTDDVENPGDNVNTCILRPV